MRPAGAWGRLKPPVWSANPPYNRTLFMVSYAYNLTPFIVSYAYVMGFLSEVSQKSFQSVSPNVGEVSHVLPSGAKLRSKGTRRPKMNMIHHTREQARNETQNIGYGRVYFLKTECI